jgi:hypothetical protein
MISVLNMLRWFQTKIGVYVGAIVLSLVTVFSIRQAGKRARDVENMEQTIKAIRVRNEINDDIAHDEHSAGDRLRKEWQRD